MTSARAPLPAPAEAAASAALEKLHPLLEPAPPSWMPQTVGWAVLAAALLLLGAWLGWRAWQRWQARRYRRLAARRLQQLRALLKSGQTAPAQRLAAARELPALVRRLALAHAPREQIAPLQGPDWARWLDRSLPGADAAFERGAGRRLGDWAYLPESALPWPELDGLLALIERWIHEHRPPEPAA